MTSYKPGDVQDGPTDVPKPSKSPGSDSKKRNLVDDAVGMYHKLYQLPSITRATFVPLNTDSPSGTSTHNSESLRARFALTVIKHHMSLNKSTCSLSTTTALVLETSHKSISTLSKRSGTQSIILTSDDNVVATSPVTFTAADVQHVAVAPDGKKQAVFRSIPAKEGKEGRKFIEIVGVQDGNLIEEIELSKEHGDWYFDSEEERLSRSSVTNR